MGGHYYEKQKQKQKTAISARHSTTEYCGLP